MSSSKSKNAFSSDGVEVISKNESKNVFSSDAVEVISRKIENLDTDSERKCFSELELSEYYEIERCVSFILNNNYHRVKLICLLYNILGLTDGGKEMYDPCIGQGGPRVQIVLHSWTTPFSYYLCEGMGVAHC